MQDPKGEWCGPAGFQQTGLRVQKRHPDHSGAGPFLKVPLTGILGTEAGKETPLLDPQTVKRKTYFLGAQTFVRGSGELGT